jgi:hypothetical protein
MDVPSLDTSAVIPADVVFRELDGEAVILNLDTGTYFGLDRVGTRMWQLIEQHSSLKKVLAALVDEFDAPADHLERDLLAFAALLMAKGLIAHA